MFYCIEEYFLRPLLIPYRNKLECLLLLATVTWRVTLACKYQDQGTRDKHSSL